MEYVREQAFEMMVSEIILGEEFDKLGLSVSDDELFDLVQGDNPHQAVRQMFTDPQTGAFNRSVLLNFLQNMNQDPSGQQLAYWTFMESQILNDQLISKYSNLIRKGLFVPGFMAREEATANSRTVDFDFIVQRYNLIPDSSVMVTTADLKKYYNEHPLNWKQQPSRDVEYVAFQTVPSAQDHEKALKETQKIKTEFETSTNDQQFVSLNSDAPYALQNYTAAELPVQAASLFDAAPGTTVGPYEEGNALIIAKLIQMVNVPDSVRARHILIQPKANNQIEIAKARSLADSLQNVIANGGDFAIQAVSFSADQGSLPDGGDLGWVTSGMMVPEFDQAIFSRPQGEVFVIETQFGFHVVQVTDRSAGVKKAQVVMLQKNVIASSETMQKLYTEASRFAAENRTAEAFAAAAKKSNYSVLSANYLRENDSKIGLLGNARQIVRWAFQSDQDDISEVFSLDNAYVVARVSAVRDEEKAPLAQVRNEVEVQVRKDKKAEQIMKKLAESSKDKSSLLEVAGSLGAPVMKAKNISFASYSVPDAGMEPNLVAASSALPVNTLSSPVKGFNGVYLLEVAAVRDTTPELDIAVNRLKMAYESRSTTEAIQTLRELAKVKDLRSKFY